jgi:hypothetical protein
MFEVDILQVWHEAEQLVQRSVPDSHIANKVESLYDGVVGVTLVGHRLAEADELRYTF